MPSRSTIVLLALVCGAVLCGAYLGTRATRGVGVRTAGTGRSERLEQAMSEMSCRLPVPTNRGADVPDGYRGDVHPLLTGPTKLEVKAYWADAQVNLSVLLPGRPVEFDVVRWLYLDVSPAVPTRSYSAREFSAFLPPDRVGAAGQLWAVDPERVAVFLKQFHPVVSAHSASVGRRPGPDGAFAVLRGVSSSYLDIVFRVHAEFDLAPKADHFPALCVWYTPSSFQGRIVVNRTTGTVEYFRIGVPTEQALNIHSTVLVGAVNDSPDRYDASHQHLRADRMELVGGSLSGLDGVHWADQIAMPRAEEQLAKTFYRFKEINFVPFTEALATARAHQKPIFAAVMLGAMDDQSC